MKLNRRTFLKMSAVGVGAVLTSPLLSACSFGGGETGPIKVGLLITYTGPAGLFGPPTENAARLAVSEINEAGGVLGRQLELVIGDDETTPQKANEEANRLVLQEEVDIMIGMHSSASREAALPVVQEADKVYIYTPVYEGQTCEKNLYALGEVPNQQISPVIPYIMTEFGGSNWFFIGNDYIWPRTSNEAARAAVEAAGGTVVGEDYVPLGTSDYSAVISRIQATAPDHIFQTLVGGDGIAFQKQLFDFGVTQDVQVLTALLEENSAAALGEAAAGVRSSFAYFHNLDTPNNQAFLEEYFEAYGSDAPPVTSLSESVYEAIHIFARGAETAGSLATDELLAGMDGVTFDGPRGEVVLQGSNRHMDQHIYLGEVQADGQFEVIHDFGLVESGEVCRI